MRNNGEQANLSSPQGTHRAPGSYAGGGALKTQGTGEDPEKESQDMVGLRKRKEVSVSKERIISYDKETKEDKNWGVPTQQQEGH